MADLTGFNANEHESNSFDVIPAGEYEAVIVKSEKKATSSGTGEMLKLQLQIVGGTYQNRVLFDQLNIKNENPTAQKIALATLADICKAVNVMTPKDSSDLHDKTMRIKVVVKNSDQYGQQNNIKGYKPRHATSAAPAAVTPAPGQYANSAGTPGQLQTAGGPPAPAWANK